MSWLVDPRFWFTFGATGLATWLLAVLVRRVRAGVPLVGGAALVIGLALALPRLPRDASVLPLDAWVILTVVGVFLVGLLDDLLELKPFSKLATQALALAPLCIGTWRADDPAAGLGILLLGLLFLNVANTFDNADGALASVCAGAMVLVRPLVFAALLGFLCFNLNTTRRGGRRVPTAYLGDAGSNVLALLVLLHPQAWPCLWIALLDLARLCVVRWRVGSRPWIGDRRHLAHRLQARGLPPLGVAGVLTLSSLPGVLGVALGRTALPALSGLGASAVLYVGVLLWTPSPDACPSPEATE